MPILSTVGRRSWHMRLSVAALYLVLALGAVTMVYPFLLMLSTSLTSQADVEDYRIVPAYLHDDDMLFAKFAEAKYVRAEQASAAYGREIFEFREIRDWMRERRAEMDRLPAAALEARLRDWREFSAALPLDYKSVAFGSAQGLTGRAEARYRAFVEARFAGDLARCQEEYRERPVRFGALEMPFERLSMRDYLPESTAKCLDFLQFKAGLTEEFLVPVVLDSRYAQFLKRRFQGDLEGLNREWQTSFESFREIHLPLEAPQGTQQRQAWTDFVRGHLPLTYLGVVHGLARLDDAPGLSKRTAGATVAGGWEAHALPGIDRPALLAPSATRPGMLEFVRRQPVENLRALTVENLYREFLRQRYRTLEDLNRTHACSAATWEAVAPPLAESDWHEMRSDTAKWRWYFATRNYAEVFQYILLHGRAVWNTLVLVVLSLCAHLTVNPLAAYALSRFQLPYAHKVLLFCLATMAFPPEVAMIPSFLMLRSFPLAQFVVGSVMAALALGIYVLVSRRRWPWWPGLLVAAGLGLAASQAVPGGQVTLLNSYWALILPGMANGFAIFLLKGFFDTLPKELFEAATLEGASEWSMFRKIALPICAPVLAVIGLSTFTAAYGSFMWAFLVCQKEEMWTLMVWLYEMQQWAPKSLLTAALTVAAVPTLIAFIVSQRVILRGIVLPTLH